MIVMQKQPNLPKLWSWMKAEDGIWLNLKTENPSVALKRPDLYSFLMYNIQIV